MPPGIQSYNNQSVVALNESFIDHNMSLKGNQVSDTFDNPRPALRCSFENIVNAGIPP